MNLQSHESHPQTPPPPSTATDTNRAPFEPVHFLTDLRSIQAENRGKASKDRVKPDQTDLPPAIDASLAADAESLNSEGKGFLRSLYERIDREGSLLVGRFTNWFGTKLMERARSQHNRLIAQRDECSSTIIQTTEKIAAAEQQRSHFIQMYRQLQKNDPDPATLKNIDEELVNLKALKGKALLDKEDTEKAITAAEYTVAGYTAKVQETRDTIDDVLGEKEMIYTKVLEAIDAERVKIADKKAELEGNIQTIEAQQTPLRSALNNPQLVEELRSPYEQLLTKSDRQKEDLLKKLFELSNMDERCVKKAQAAFAAINTITKERDTIVGNISEPIEETQSAVVSQTNDASLEEAHEAPALQEDAADGSSVKEVADDDSVDTQPEMNEPASESTYADVMAAFEEMRSDDIAQV